MQKLGLKVKYRLIVILVGLCLVSLIGCVRPTIDQAVLDISIEQAPYILEFRNSGWIDGAILMEGYEVIGSSLKIVNYYDRQGFHEEVKYIPMSWLIRIIEREER